MQKWEYIHFVRASSSSEEWFWTDGDKSAGQQARLNKMGLEGWELVSVVARDVGYTEFELHFYFKRSVE
jgi:hypothetical protein